MHVRTALPCLFLLSLPAAATAQGGWTFRSLVTNPPAGSPTMVFDTQRNVAVLAVPGQSNTVEAWEWNGSAWQRRSTTGPSSPYMRYHTALAFDAARNVSVLFGGAATAMQQPGQQLLASNETWLWDGLGWNNTFATPAPPARCKHAMVYDGARGVTVLFGGVTESTQGGPNAVYSDTWLWDGQSWVSRSPVAPPPPRHGHAMAYDSARQRVVLFGGTNRFHNQSQVGTLRYFGETWEWDGSNWFQVFPAVSPSPRQEAAIAYDSRTRLTVLHGGIDANNQPLGDTWLWDGSSWRQTATHVAPASRFDAAMAFDSARGTTLLFGGSNSDWVNYIRDTWEFAPGAPASYTAFGAGCAGSRGPLTLGARLGSLPVAGQTFFAQVNGLPLMAPVFMFLGASRTAYGPLPLPLDLTPLGMTGCSLYVSGDFLFPATNILGSGSWSLDIPLDLAGQRFFNQAIALDSLGNAAGLTTSNGAEALVGR